MEDGVAGCLDDFHRPTWPRVNCELPLCILKHMIECRIRSRHKSELTEEAPLVDLTNLAELEPRREFRTAIILRGQFGVGGADRRATLFKTNVNTSSRIEFL